MGMAPWHAVRDSSQGGRIGVLGVKYLKNCYLSGMLGLVTFLLNGFHS